jgi:hypothetical protein
MALNTDFPDTEGEKAAPLNNNYLGIYGTVRILGYFLQPYSVGRRSEGWT